MINNDLVGYLRLVVSPEACDIMVNAYTVLTQTGSTAHEFAITQYLLDTDNMDTVTTVALIDRVLVESLEESLGAHGIGINPDRDTSALALLTALVEMLSSIDSYGDPETLYNICVSDASPEEQLCELATFFTPFTESDYLPLIHTCSSDLIRIISEQVAEVAEDSANGEYATELANLTVPITEIRERTRNYVSNKPHLQLHSLLRNSMPLGLDIELYIDQCRDFLSTLLPKEIVPEIVALAYASDTVTTEIRKVVVEQIQILIGDYRSITQANIALSNEAL